MKYAWLLIIGVILLIIGLWLSYALQIKEGMADTGSIMLVGINTSNQTYIADTGLANSVKWLSISGTFKQISGSFGQVIGVNSTNLVFYGKQDPDTISSYTLKQIPGTAIQVNFDYPFVAGIDEGGSIST